MSNNVLSVIKTSKKIQIKHFPIKSQNNNLNIAYLQNKTTDHRLNFMLWHGLGSDMCGRKGLYLFNYCLKNDLNCLLFDYSGHGRSQGDYLQQTMTNWRQEGLQLLQNLVTSDHTVIIASSLGAWLALLIYLQQSVNPVLKTKISGLILLCPAINFTQDIVTNLTNIQKQNLKDHGYYRENNTIITNNLLQDGQNSLIDNQTLQTIPLPVTVIHGYRDCIVNYTDSLNLVNHLDHSRQRTMYLLPYADHRLRDQVSINVLHRAIQQMHRIIC